MSDRNDDLGRVLPWRLLRDARAANLYRFVVGAGLGNLRALAAFERRRRRGAYFPAFLFISVTQRCNLSCKGCWATGAAQPADMGSDLLESLIREGLAQGVRFFGILGGEPLLWPGLPEVLARWPQAYFLLFTNGLLLDEAMAGRLTAAGNISPLVSVEGGAESYGLRREVPEGFARATAAVTRCRAAGMVTGAAWSVSRSNFDETVASGFVDRLVEAGAHYVWPYIYRPSGVEPGFDEALDDEQVRAVRRFVVDERRRRDVVIVDAYWDHAGRALCPAATGISLHVNAAGQIEPCPPVQFSDAGCAGGRRLADAVAGSALLSAFRREVPGWTRGCPLMDHPRELAALART